jgi:hypothetical protein
MNCEEVLGHLAVTGTDFDPAMLIVARERHGGMRRNADGARDLFAPMEIGEEVLAEALACHGWNSVARGVTGDSQLPCGYLLLLALLQFTVRWIWAKTSVSRIALGVLIQRGGQCP